MLYNPEWQKPEPWTLASLIAWLEKQNPHDGYTYTSPGNCLIAQYAKAMGYGMPSVGRQNLSVNRFKWFPLWRKTIPLPEGFDFIALSAYSFGGALKRAKGYSIFLQGRRPQDRPEVSSEISESIA